MLRPAIGILLPLLPFLTPGSPGSRGDRAVRFSRDVRPILSDRCFACHGPDEATREAGLRLDLEPGARARLDSGHRAIVPGDADGSELLRRVSASDPAKRMPPPETGDPLTDVEVDLLRRWIEQGGEWEEHWSFVPPRRPSPPAAAPDLARNAIDAFVLARLDGSDLAPNPEADRAALLRRATYDLTGLPPTHAELDAFLADDSDGAWERALERLFASPRHGEHMARPWLDAARYADTHGLHLDNERSMWPYRDWVVTAFQQNLPFDEFVVEQLAGDLLPEPTLDQLVASGFNRCNPTSAEGGMIQKEYLSIYAKDRVDTTATVFMGLTLECSKCHDHKFDPFSQREYYELLGFFNSLAEEATDRNIANPVPFIRVPDAAQQARLDEFDERITALAVEVDAPMPEVDAAQAAWEAEWRARLADRWRILVPDAATAANGTTFTIQDDDSILAGGENPATEVVDVRAHVGEERVSALRLEALVGGGNAEKVPGRSANQNFVLTGVELEAFPPGRPEEAVAIPIVEVFAEHSQDQYPVRNAIDGNAGTGWGGLGREGSRSAIFVPAAPFGYPGGTEVRVRLRYESKFAAHVIGRFRLAIAEDPDLGRSTLGAWSRLGPFADADGRAALTKDYGPEASSALGDWIEEPDYIDGEIQLFPNEVGAVYVRRTIDAPSARVLRAGVGSDDGVRIWLNGALVHDNPAARAVALDQDTVELPLRAGTNDLLLKVANYGGGFGFAFRRLSEEVGGAPLDVTLALETEPDARSDAQRVLLRDHFRRRHAPAWIALNEELAAVRAERAAFEAALPTTLVSRELDEPRPAHVLVRGQYDAEADLVERDVPDVLPPLPADAPRDRLGLARWLVSGEHPLTARVYVNRLWMQLFGHGLVRTPEDFGSQGKYPTHPDLLDWLACEFVDSGWDVRHMLRLMMTSSAYRRDSRATAEALALDPENALLARGPRWRHDGEVLRDTALSLSGLLVEEVGGPPARPYQPRGVWKAVGYTSSNTANYRAGAGDSLYRRSLYTFWKRTAPPPNMVTFDAPSREACTVQRARTNTPLQALVLLNDPQFIEAARRFARRALVEGGADDDARLAWAFRAATSRPPDADELDLLREVLGVQREHFAADPAGAEALLEVGEAPRDETLSPVEHAAWTSVTSLLLNLDETVSRS